MGPAVFAVLLALLLLAGGLSLRAELGDKLPERASLRARSAGLTAQDRWRVRRAVQKGRAVRDPSLAAAAVARARYSRAYGRRFTGGRGRWAFPILAAMQIVVAGERVMTPSTHSFLRWSGAGASALLGLLLGTIPWQLRFYGRRADRAEQLNLELLYLQQERNRST